MSKKGRMYFWKFEFWNLRIFGSSNTKSGVTPWHKGPAAGGRGPLLVPCTLTGPRCLCQIAAAAADALVLVAEPLLRVPPPVRDAGPLVEPPVPPLLQESIFADLFRIYLPPRLSKEENQSKASKHDRNGIRIYPGFIPDLFTSMALPTGAAVKYGEINPPPR